MTKEASRVGDGEKGTVLGEKEKRTIVVICRKKASLKVKMMGEGSEVTVLGVAVGRGEDVLELGVEVTHLGVGSKAEIFLRGVVFDRAKVYIRGSVNINKGARLADDYLREDLLLVGEKAGGETYPYLEIEENDVTARHAATMGRVDDEQLFYLATRGLSRKDGEALLIDGFFEPLVEKVPQADRDTIRAEIREKLSS